MSTDNSTSIVFFAAFLFRWGWKDIGDGQWVFVLLRQSNDR